MDAIKKKMQAMKIEKVQYYVTQNLQYKFDDCIN